MNRILVYTDKQTVNLNANTMIIDEGTLFIYCDEDLIGMFLIDEVKMAYKTEPKEKG